MFSAGHPSTTTRLLVATAVLLAAAVGATQRGSVADATTGCGSDEPGGHGAHHRRRAGVLVAARALQRHGFVHHPRRSAAGPPRGAAADAAGGRGLRRQRGDDGQSLVRTGSRSRRARTGGRLTRPARRGSASTPRRRRTCPTTSSGSSRRSGHCRWTRPSTPCMSCTGRSPNRTRPRIERSATASCPRRSRSRASPSSHRRHDDGAADDHDDPVTTTTAAPSTTVPPALPATEGSEVEDQILRNRRVGADVPSAPAAVEMRCGNDSPATSSVST